MTDTATRFAALLLAVLSFGLGYWVAPTARTVTLESSAPPAPRSPTQAAQDVARVGEIRGALLETNPFARVEAIAALLATFGEDDLPSVVEVLKRNAIGLGAAESDLMTRFWASYQPEAAIKWAWSDSPDGFRSSAVDAAVFTVALKTPEAALLLLQKQENITQYDADVGREALVRGWFLSGLPGLEDYLRALGHDVPQQRAMSALANVMVHRDGPEALAQWLEDLEDEGHMFKKTAHRRAVPELLLADREYAVEWCETHCNGPYGEYLQAIVAKTWAITDGRAAMQWVSTSPEGPERDRAVRAAFIRWRMYDPDGLLRFIDEMDPKNLPPWFMSVVDLVAMWKSWDYPLEAYEWAALIEKDQDRELAFISITRRFREADEPAAEAWLEQSWLSEEARAKAREFPKKWRGRGARPYPPPPKQS